MVDTNNFIGIRNYNNVIELYERDEGVWNLLDSYSNVGTLGLPVSLETLGDQVRIIDNGTQRPWFTVQGFYGDVGVVQRKIGRAHV